ncbi:unnamed protein product [Prunus armeniaca]|uniref:Uncharacterized protein n=1 Tax=Prunus armeniaca TaxID=36596 RepID=A0A6J5TLD3_PRUAR|nr:unnamed protein product [Prunus armeniaca]
MSTFQIASSQPSICFRNTSQALRPSPKLLLLPTCLQPTNNASIRQQRMPVLKAQQCRVLSKYHRSAPVCLLGGKGKSESGDEMDQSIEDVLRQQIEKNEFYEERGGGGGGGGSGRGSGGDGAGGSGSEDEGLAGIMDETLQVILATIGFIFLRVVYLEVRDERQETHNARK